MAEDSRDSRLFDEKDVGSILKRAAQMQESEAPVRFGLTLRELQQVAVEAGIDPKYVFDAAAELDRRPASKANLWGGPLLFSRETVIEGEIEDRGWEEMVSEIRKHFKDTGEVRTWSHAREWAHSGKNNTQAHVTVTTRDGETRLLLFWHEPILAAPVYAPALVLSLISLPIVFEALALTGFAGAIAWIIMVSIILFIARFVMSKVSGKMRRDAADLHGRLERIARNGVTRSKPTRTETSVPEASPLKRHVDLDEAEPPEVDEATETSRRRQRER